MTNRISIALVICTYNNAMLLNRTLSKISEQQVPPEIEWQVLVVNNNCTDETDSVVEKYMSSGKIAGLAVVHEPEQGLTPARLCGVKNTDAEWIAFIDDDCLLDPDWVAQAATFASAHPNCGAFGGAVILEWETPPSDLVLKYAYSFAEQNHGSLPKPVPFLAGAGVVIRRMALIECGWVDRQFLQDRVGNKLISGGDVEMALRLAAKYELWYNPACRLKHFIPVRRTSKEYLIKINYSLGISQQYANGMVWSSSYMAWLIVSTYQICRASVQLLWQSLHVALRRMKAVEALINLSFVMGRWRGLWNLHQMGGQERSLLLGCAKPSSILK